MVRIGLLSAKRVEEADPLQQGLKPLSQPMIICPNLNVEEADPLQQGLKLHAFTFHRERCYRVEEADPLQQGLKHGSPVYIVADSIVEEADPLQQGLKPSI